ncbi:peptide alpha-N-acetyltransferase complex A subunit [Pichia kluyveri]|uniref:Peptide alpha-N-acetyltransferase complex A subunit n=1 Tax=Pichia kluyveri TaxID=36015 RepID=A0AAV5QZS2_PICKL|nr:peptide alpha-N-acetyltransferase complex A subunit [Pichia kluyveri]
MAEVELQFRDALQNYENKNYKKSLTLIDKILKKNSLHSQSYALKALIIHFYHPQSPDLKDPNLLISTPPNILSICNDLIKTSVKYGPSNSISAHLAALYYRQIKNYEMATHFYTIAYSNNPSNKGILRDLSSCLSQLRTYKSLIKTRFDYLQAEPGYRANYSSTSIAYYLNNDFNNSIKIENQIENIIKDKLIDEDLTENSECLIYKALLFFNLEKYDETLDYINNLLISNEKFKCYDITGLLELKFKTLMILEKFHDAQLTIRLLLKRNPLNVQYYYDLFNSLKIENNTSSKLIVLNKLSKFYPKVDIPKFLPLTFLNHNDEQFKSHLSNYLQDLFKRGVPSVFNNIKSLYNDSNKIPIILNIVKSFEEIEKNPLILTWIKYFLSHHFDKINQFDLAIDYINQSIEITPTLIELYMFKARILKHQNHLIEASKIMNDARLLDLQDRFVNSKTVKYYLRADLINEAIDVASLFTKNDDEPKGVKDLHIVQCRWFITEYSKSLTRLFKKSLNEFEVVLNNDHDDDSNEDSNITLIQKKVETYLGLALQRYFSIFQIYAEYYEDQFDFHFYAFRKGTLRSYLQMIDWEDNLYHESLVGEIYSDLMSLISFTKENNKLLLKALDHSLYLNKRSKKDKKDEIKWKDNMLIYNKVLDSDPLGNELINKLIKNNELDKIDELEKLINRCDGKTIKPETVYFINGQFNYDFINGKYVVALASIRKIKEISNSNSNSNESKIALKLLNEMLERINKFIETEFDDPKTKSLQKVVKLGLMRL